MAMRVLLVNFQSVQDVRFFDPSTGTLEESNQHSWKDADGRFFEQDGSLICLFRSRDRIYLYLGGVNATVDSELTTTMETGRESRRFRAYLGSEVLFDKVYPRKPDTDGNPFWPSDAEDEDILLWVHHIASSPERQQILLANSRRKMRN